MDRETSQKFEGSTEEGNLQRLPSTVLDSYFDPPISLAVIQALSHDLPQPAFGANRRSVTHECNPADMQLATLGLQVGGELANTTPVNPGQS